MFDRILILLILTATAQDLFSQINPPDGAKLNYTQVMFEYEQVKGADAYAVQIAEDTGGAAFIYQVAEQIDSATATLFTGLHFGKKYKWRYAGISKGVKMPWDATHHFEIAGDSVFNLEPTCHQVTINDSTRSMGGLIINDATHSIMDRKGTVVWYLPHINWQFKFSNKITAPKQIIKQQVNLSPYISDLRLTPYGTVTFMHLSTLTDCDLSGGMIWEKHYSDSVSDCGEEHYHHAFSRQSDGHYLALGSQQWLKMPDSCDPQLEKKYSVRKIFNNTEYGEVEFGTAIEYDKNGHVVWCWNSRDYMDSNPLLPRGKYEYLLPKAHANALSTDGNHQYVYMGFRDISRIIKIEKKTGRVVDSWGALVPGAPFANHGLNILKQHDANILDNGNILVYNNNNFNDSPPSVIMFSQHPENSGEVVWQYYCDLDTAERHKSRIYGNADMLKNGNILVCMGSSDIIFEVTPDKKKVWQMTISSNDKLGYEYSHQLYRAHYVSSLYPCFFTFQEEDKGSQKLNIRIFNKGSEPDAYDVKIFSAGKEIKQFATDTLAAYHSATVLIDKNSIPGQKVEIAVSSKTNPDLEKKRELIIIR